VDRDLRNTLRRQGLGMRSVPAAGQVVTVKTVVNDNRREDNEAALERICPSLVAAGAKAAAAVGARLAGVDIITRDPGVPLEESGGVVLEVNTTPGHYYHYKKRTGGTRVARLILQRVFAPESP
jgi:cyanophycin synthetase